MKNKGSRINITLECMSCRSIDLSEKRTPGVFRYTSTKSENTTNRLELKKFCPNCNSHKDFKEIK
uniref:ribosomal protein L33 n=1 Tax=Rhodella violacea TaxID=2801 RepID=UPI001FCDD68F|nr:ribosomal protein L33 [Rhodella violacea]UNJ18066.1 ribosomal protein L33 [Rhodella violacea]